MSLQPVSVKRSREAGESTDSSQDFSTAQQSDIACARKAELLKKARKKARKNHGAETDGCVSIKAHFSETSKTNQSGATAMAAAVISSSAVDVSPTETGLARVECQDTGGSISNADIMKKLCDMCDQLTQLNTTVHELRGEVFDLKQENDKLKTQLERCRIRQEGVVEEVKEAKFLASVAERRVNDLEQYTRRNNVRVFGVSEPHGETVEDCETKVLKILNEKLELRRMESGDIEAAHRIGKPVQRRGGGQQPARPRPIIVRFLSRKATEVVLRNRRKLKNSGIVIVEDLTHENFILLHKCRDHAGVQDAWARRGSIYVKTVRDSKIQKISQASDLQLLPVVPTTSTPTSQSQQRQRSPLQSDQSLMATNANSIEDKRVSGDSNGHQSQGK